MTVAGPQQCEMAVGGPLSLADLCMYVRMIQMLVETKGLLAMSGGVIGQLLALTGARAGGVRIVSPQRESNPRPVAAAQAIIFAHPGIEPSPLR